MVNLIQYVKAALAHTFLMIVNFCVLLGIYASLDILFNQSSTLPFLNLLLLTYMTIHTGILLVIQIGIQVLEVLKKKMPVLLISYYFSFSDQEEIPDSLFDPIKSKLAVIVLLLVISGGIVLFPLYAIVGMLLLWVRLPIIIIQPTTVILYFSAFLDLVPPLLLLAAALIVVSIVIIEFKRQ